MFTTGRRTGAVAVGLAIVLLAACGDDEASADGRLDVRASFYPLAWLAEEVGGDRVDITSLTEPGAEPHDLELTPADVADVVDADLVVFLAGFQPAVDDAVEQADADAAFDVTDPADLELGVEHGEEGEEHHADDGHDHADDAVDPHFWLDPIRLGDVAIALAERLGEVDPDHRADYRAAALEVQGSLEALDAAYRTALTTCARRDLVTGHTAFGYLAGRYDLVQVGIAGLSPEDEPSPSDLAEVADFVRAHGVTTIFFETLVSPAIAETIASETGATTARLDPLEGLAPDAEGDDYLQVMGANLEHLRQGLGCP